MSFRKISENVAAQFIGIVDLSYSIQLPPN
uniref:Uncharacterized protein n=1 Tax=Arundo donax TaxID=35708 RepID=A0A0A9C1R8_ARUDO